MVTKVVVISYVPLLTGEPGRVLSVGDEEFTRLMAEAERCPSGRADACLWMADNGGVFPVLVMPQAHAIAEHLAAWAENRPGDSCVLCSAQRQGRYVAASKRNSGQVSVHESRVTSVPRGTESRARA